MAAGAYRIGKEIGRGAIGRVVLLHDDAKGEVFAGKILHPSHQGDEKARSRFGSEAAMLASLHDENIVRVYGLESIEGQEVLRMELVSGDDLAKHLAVEGPLTSTSIVEIASSVASGLRAAHIAGLVHRDLKPQNILLTESGVPKIADFGMAKAASFDGVDESAFAVAGTPDYMAPECITPLAVDSRADLYALGCILYEMATGLPPFTAATSFGILEAHRTLAVAPIAENIPDGLKELIYALLEKVPADRPQSATEVMRRLNALSSGASSALVLQRGAAMVLGGTCAYCGQTLVSSVSTCFGCGHASVRLEPGKHTLFVVGPGETGDKLDTQLRARLLVWLQSSPGLGLDPAPLAEKVPRLPFVMATKCSEGSAKDLGMALEELGLRYELLLGGRYALPSMRKKSWLLGRRVIAIVGASTLYMYSTLGALLIPAIGVGIVGSLVGGWVLAGKSVAKPKRLSESSLPAAVQNSLAGLSVVLSNIELQRHRDGLRGVVERVLSLCEDLEQGALKGSESDLARLLDIALIACSRMDEIEVALANSDLRNPSEQTSELLRERDRWAGRLLEVTAFLDSLRARSALLRHEGDPGEVQIDRIEQLRTHIEALEEVQSL